MKPIELLPWKLCFVGHELATVCSVSNACKRYSSCASLTSERSSHSQRAASAGSVHPLIIDPMTRIKILSRANHCIKFSGAHGVSTAVRKSVNISQNCSASEATFGCGCSVHVRMSCTKWKASRDDSCPPCGPEERSHAPRWCSPTILSRASTRDEYCAPPRSPSRIPPRKNSSLQEFWSTIVRFACFFGT